MRLTLLRHGIAEDHAATDFDRALTAQGVAQLERVLDGLCGSGWVPGAILHSPLLRTTQTAAAVARRFPRVPLVGVAELAGEDLAGILHAAAPYVEPVLVGHQPTLGELLAELIGASPGTTALPRAGVAMVEVDRLPPRRRAHLVAFLPPPEMPPG